MKIFFTCKNTVFVCKSVDGQHAAESTRDAPQRDTFEVGIALLTAASSSADNGVTVCIGVAVHVRIR